MNLQEQDIQELKNSFFEQNLEEKDIIISQGNNCPHKSKYLWTRISHLWISLDQWETSPEFQTYVSSHNNSLKQIKEEHSALSEKIRPCFKMSEAFKDDKSLEKALRECANHYIDQLKKHQQKVADFMSCALLNTKNDDERTKEISRMGFKTEYNKGISIDLLTLLFLVILLILLIGFGLSQWFQSSMESFSITPKKFLITIMVTTLYSLGIVSAITAKKYCDRKAKNQHAWATYILAAMISAFIGSIISILVNSIIEQWNLFNGFNAFIHGFDGKPPKWPWQIMIFSTTFLTAVLLNEKRFKDVGRTKRRFIEGLIMAVNLLFSFLIVNNLMQLGID